MIEDEVKTLVIHVMSDDLASSTLDDKALDHPEYPFDTRWTITTPSGDVVVLRVDFGNQNWCPIAAMPDGPDVAVTTTEEEP